eukprot:jgi/Psemu1/323742/estExt_fgenesh1_pg.C_930002
MPSCCGNGLRPCQQQPQRNRPNPNLDASANHDCDILGDSYGNDNDNGNGYGYGNGYDNGDVCEDPWTYANRRLRHLEFPLGGFGTGNVLLKGDGTLDGWDIQNQFRNAEYTPLHSLPLLPGDKLDHDLQQEQESKSESKSESESNTRLETELRGCGNNCWAIAAAWEDDGKDDGMDDGKDEHEHEPIASQPRPSFLLRSANHGHTEETTSAVPRSSSRPPCVPSLKIKAQYPIATVSYDTPPSFPLEDIQLEAMTPLVPTATYESSFPMALFTISFANSHPTKTVSPFVYTSPPPPPPPPNPPSRNGDDSCDDHNAAKETCFHDNHHGVTCTGLFLYNQNDLKQDLTRKGSTALSAIHRVSKSGSGAACVGNDPCQRTRAASTYTGSDGEARSRNPRHPAAEGAAEATEATEAPSPMTPTIGLITGVTSSSELFRRFASRDFEDPPGSEHEDGAETTTESTPPSPQQTTYIGAVVQSLRVPPGSRASVTFCLSWHFPYRLCTAPRPNLPPDFFGNRYSHWFTHAEDVARKLCDTLSGVGVGDGDVDRSVNSRIQVLSDSEAKPKDVLELTRLYVKTLYSSTIPWQVLESAAGRVAVARSPTMFWAESGIVLANEGNDCCPLNCTHVWGYTTLLERLFPDLAKDMRTSDFVRNFDIAKHGGCSMRFGQDVFAIDGGLACVIKTYLVVLQADPGLDFLKTVWPNVKSQMEEIFANHLDAKEGVILIPQQNTYDTAMEGANTFIGSYLVTALRATAAMATLMGDVNFSKKCQKQAEASAARYEELCWSEDFGYYVADVDETNCEYSYGPGCFIDQLSAIGLSTACGLGYVFRGDREARARKAIVQNNKVTCPPFRDLQCHFYNGDSGLRVCSYPNGKLGNGMVYTDLVSSGFTYPVVAGLIFDGNWEDATRVCTAIRARQSGIHRSPWNEPECGLYYARSMAAWNLLDQACGFSYDSIKASIGFSPRINASSFSVLENSDNPQPTPTWLRGRLNSGSCTDPRSSKSFA